MNISQSMLVFAICSATRLAAQNADQNPALGHSLHGEAFDEGPRQEARKLEGMGEIQFPVSTANPEAQAFFNQGVAQLHTFYYFEAERSFRQVALLDPDCAMAYWGMAMANQNNGKRARAFLKEAEGKAARITDRERKHLDALAKLYEDDKKDDERRRNYVQGLEAVVLAYPDDIEAKAFLAWTIVSNSFAGERLNSWVAVNVLIEEVLKRSPMHPGAHHYRIHLWDRHDPEQALQSARSYAQAAPGIAHAWHMPGHIFNGLSRWKEAVYQQEGSSRVDHAHMLATGILPFQIHNYAHNQHYLIANLNHLGGLRDGIACSRNLIEEPCDPQMNDAKNGGAQRLGRHSLMRLYTRYERWDDLLADPHLDWSDAPIEKAWKAYSLGLAHLGKGERDPAREQARALDDLHRESSKSPNRDAELMEVARLELGGRLKISDGKLIEGFEMLNQGVRLQVEKFKEDLSGYTRPMHEVLGFAHLECRDYGLAEAHFREVLEHRKNTIVSLAGLVEACGKGGKQKEAAEAYHQFLAASQTADPDLPYRRRLEALFPSLAEAARAEEKDSRLVSGAAAPRDGVGSGQTPAVPLEPLGPKLWTPMPAPDFSLEDAAGKRVSLEGIRGKNAILTFFLGSGCPHCMEQLFALGKEKDALEKLGAAVLAISDDPPDRSRDLLAGPRGKELPLTFLSDPGRAAAGKYHVFDSFEKIPLHGIFLIDRQGKVRWSRIGADPFMDIAFLKAEIERFNKFQDPVRVKSDL